MADEPLTKRRRKQWCYDCGSYTLTHAYSTTLLEERIDLCDHCVTGGSTETADRQPHSTAHEQPATSAPRERGL